MNVHRAFRNVMVTGGAGFIGTGFIRYLLGRTEFTGRIVNVDKLTYAGNPGNLEDIAAAHGDRYRLERVDICDPEAISSVFERFGVDTVVHLAAESHVDRSIVGPRQFVNTNVVGTFNLLEARPQLLEGPAGRPLPPREHGRGLWIPG